jgi:hypothetical protein
MSVLCKELMSIFGIRITIPKKLALWQPKQVFYMFLISLGQFNSQASYKPMSTQPNEESVRNVLNRIFQVDTEISVLENGLTYVKVGKN